MAQDYLIVGQLLGALLILLGGYVLVSHYRVFRLLSRTPTADLHSISSPGVVGITGTVSSGNSLESTISGDDTAVLSAWQAQKEGKRSSFISWWTIARGIEGSSFELADRTGSVRVAPLSVSATGTFCASTLLSLGGEGVFVDTCRAEFEQFDVTLHVDIDETHPERVQRFLARQDVQDGSHATEIASDVHVGNARRYLEGTVCDGDEIFLLGYASIDETATTPPSPEDITIGRGPDGDSPFLVSPLPKEKLMGRIQNQLRMAAGTVLLGIALIAGGQLLRYTPLV